MRVFVSNIILACLCSSSLFSTENDAFKKDKDTVNALVVYHKSLSTMPVEYYTDMKDESLVEVIDSLLDLPAIPRELIEVLNCKIYDFKKSEELHDLYPAFGYYGDTWENETANPYASKIPIKDSLFELNLGISDTSFCMPCQGPVTSQYGWRDGKPHRGIDIDVDVMDTIRAAFSGKVRVARYYGGFGRIVIIRHDNGLETFYAHLHKLKVKPNQEVKVGQLIGYGGNSGKSEGSHLHFECRFMGEAINPETFISFEDQTLKTKDLVLKKSKIGYACFPKGSEFHVVKKGDYLHKIAEEYGTTVKILCDLNGIKSNKLLVVGESLRVL